MKTHVNPILQHKQNGIRTRLVFATAYIGINISSSIVSYILIVALVTLVTLPFTFALTWRVIWENLGTILVTFVLPKILNFILMKLTKKCIFGPTFIKSRAGHLQHPPIHRVIMVSLGPCLGIYEICRSKNSRDQPGTGRFTTGHFGRSFDLSLLEYVPGTSWRQMVVICQCGQMCYKDPLESIGKYWKAIQSKIIGKFPTGIFSARILLQVW